MEFQSPVDSYFQAVERQHSILLKSDNKEDVGSVPVASDESNQDYSRKQNCCQEDKEACVHYAFDLDLPNPDNYLPETVDFPSSPSAMMKYRITEDEKDLTSDHDCQQSENRDAAIDSEDEESFRAVIDTEAPSVQLSKEGESSDSANVSDSEEYFEDFHLPISHQNSQMSTRRSFIRRVKSVEVRYPDADHIVESIKSGNLNRQGSIRRKIIPRPSDFTNDSIFSDKSPSPVKRTSTPNETFADLDPADDSVIISGQQQPLGMSNWEKNAPTYLAPLEEETLSKIKDCLDAEKTRDLYTLGSRLQDLLSPAEIEEIVNNSYRYGDVISLDLVKALIHRAPDSTDAFINRVSTRRAPPDLLNSDISRTEMVPRAQPQTVKKRIAVIDDPTHVDIDDDSDTECDLAVRPIGHPTAAFKEDVPAMQGPQQAEPQSKAELPLRTPSVEWEADSPGELGTPDRLENSLADHGVGMSKPDLIPETSLREEVDEEHKWRSVVISGLERKIDMRVIEPYKKVLSHGGYQGNDCQTAIIVFSACFLPDRSRVDYTYVMENLFLYVLTTLDQLVAEDYVLVYFHGGTPKNCIPRFSWVKNCYQMIDRRLRKNLKRLYLVHPTLWLKAAVLMCRPFISAKFSRKIVYIPNLPSLSAELPMDHVCIPDRVKQLEFSLMIENIKRQKGVR